MAKKQLWQLTARSKWLLEDADCVDAIVTMLQDAADWWNNLAQHGDKVWMEDSVTDGYVYVYTYEDAIAKAFGFIAEKQWRTEQDDALELD